MFFLFFFYDDDQGFWESELNSFHSCINQPDSSYYLEQELVHQKIQPLACFIYEKDDVKSEPDAEKNRTMFCSKYITPEIVYLKWDWT